MKRWKLAVCLGLAFGSPSKAADWWWVGNFQVKSNQTNLYIDRDTIKKAGRHAFTAVVNYVGENAYENGEVLSYTLQRYDCKARTVTTIQRRALDGQLKIIAEARLEGVPADPILPNTSAEVAMHFICRDKEVLAISVAEPFQHAQKMYAIGKVSAAATPQTAEQEPSIGSGTGFFIDASGRLVTSYHVVENATRIVVYTSDGTAHDADIARFSRATDLAILTIDYRPKHYLTLAATNSSHAGDRVFTFGFPALQILGSEPKFSEGAISSVTGIDDEASYAQITVPIQPGNSGGPLVNEHGEVVGVIASGAKTKEFVEETGSFPQNVNWAVRSEYIAPLIAAAPPAPVRTREEAIAKTRASVALVFVQFEPEQ